MRRALAAAVVALVGSIGVSLPAIAADVVIEVVARGQISGSWDATNALGYGATGNADGATVTMTYRYLVSAVPPDAYGGARFPQEADYFSYGYNHSAPSWIDSTLRFDNRTVLSSRNYFGDYYEVDQVKIMDRAGGAPFDYFGVHDRVHDKLADGTEYRALESGARVHEYVDKIVSGLEPDQKVRWQPNGDGSEIGIGDFRVYDAITPISAGGYVVLESFRVRVTRLNKGKSAP